LIESIAIFLILILILFYILESSAVAFPVEIKTASVYALLATIYYILADAFVENTLLNLTPGRIQDLNIPFNIDPSFVQDATWMVTSLLSVVLVSGFAFLQNGNIKPRQYDRAIQLLTVVAFVPFILYFWLHVLYLKQTDESWLFELDFMGEMSGFTLSNEWPFQTVLQDSRWTFYRVGLFNAIRVVILSIIGSTILGVFVGVSRLSRNKLLSGLAESYVEFFRNMPLVVQLFFLYTVVLGANLPKFEFVQDNTLFGWVYWSNRGIVGPGAGIENMSYFLAAFAVYLGARTYIRFSERIESTKSVDIWNPLLILAEFRIVHLLGTVIRRFFKNQTEPRPTTSEAPTKVNSTKFSLAVDILFSISILIVIYGLFNAVEWNYKISFIDGLLEKESFSMFKIGVIMLIVAGLLRFKLDAAGLNNFTADDSAEGQRNRSILWGVTILLMFAFFYMAIWYEQPNLITERNGEPISWGLWKFEDGTNQTISSVFLSLWIGLTLYTAAQIAEIVRGSIQSLPRGQVEAAISLGLSPYQRLNLIILPQALRSMIPSLTNQYLNCWKNSSLAFVVGFSDFYAVFSTIVNNAGQAVPVFIMILATYQAGSLTISAIMNYINSNVTKVKI